MDRVIGWTKIILYARHVNNEVNLRIARVFPTRTNMTPIDSDAYYGPPDLFTPEYDEVHISVAFTWDINRARSLASQWGKFEKLKGPVKIGGPAFDDLGGDFIPGLYLKPGVTITSRGCVNKCSFCFVPKREGHIRELEIKEGNIIQDNNLLACSSTHIHKVFSMLKRQKAIVFQGGLEASRITNEIVQELRGLRIKELWLAYDNMAHALPLERAVCKLSKYFTPRQIRCYVLIGYGSDDSIDKAEMRLRYAYELGTYPFAMLYRDAHSGRINKSKEWRELQRKWSRPAAYKTFMSSKAN